MKKISIFIFLALTGICFQQALAGAEEDFCTALKEVMASAKDGFKSIMTDQKQEKDDFFGKVTVYQSNKRLPGASAATVEKGMKLTYKAEMGEDNSRSETLNNLYYTTRDKIEACLGKGFKYSEVKDDINNVLMFKAQASSGDKTDMYQPVIGLRYGKMDNTFKVVLEVEEPFFLKK